MSFIFTKQHQKSSHNGSYTYTERRFCYKKRDFLPFSNTTYMCYCKVLKEMDTECIVLDKEDFYIYRLSQKIQNSELYKCF